MKRVLACLLSICLLLTCIGTACADGYTAGTYTGVGKGNNGGIKVEVTFSADKIESVKVVEHGETAGICDKPIEQIPAAIVEKQSVEVDTVSGATNTSNGIIAAVVDAARQAGVDLTAVEQNTLEDVSCDVVVVGAGLAGLAAAKSAAENGASVVLVEKQAIVGGSGNLTSAGFYVSETAYVPAEVETHEEMYQHIVDMINEGGTTDNVELDRIRHLVDEGPALTEWLEGMGYEFTVTDFSIKDAKPHYQLLADGSMGAGQVKLITAACEKEGVSILTETECIALNQENGAMTGITVKTAEGTFNINAKSVVLTCGGYGRNQEMIMRLQPQSLFSETCTNVGATGEVLQMAADLGAAWYNDQFMLTCGFTTDPSVASLGMALYPPYASMPVIDQTGHRFMNEFLLWTLNSEMVRNVENAPFFAIFDSEFLKGTAAEFKYDALEEAIAAGSKWVFKADTLEELAARCGIKDVEAFKATIASYNSVKGTDDAEPEYGVPNNQLSFVEDGPFYAVLVVSLNAGTMGGIKTQITGEVLNYKGETMTGLYAAGEASNGGLYDRGYISGTSVLNCYIAGRDAGASAAAFAK